MKEKKIAAFFDIDGTLYRDSLMTEHFKKLIKYEVVDEKYWLNGVKIVTLTGIRDLKTMITTFSVFLKHMYKQLQVFIKNISTSRLNK